VGVPIADLNAGMFATYSILSAYISRLKTGKGQYLEVSLLESALAYTVWESASYFATGKTPGPLGSAHRLSAPYQALETSDGYINIGAPNQSNWERFCNAIGRPDLLEQERFNDNAARLTNVEELQGELEKTLRQQTRDHWLQVLEDAGVPAGPIFDMAEVWANEQVRARHMDVTTQHPTAGEVHNIGVSAKLYGTPGRIEKAAPLLGADTREILSQAGYSESEIAALLESGAAAQLES
jgi:crotonobetainyl-CoA:carnitine CoA-transferase CaiB-like acyl-CoA transferase